MSDKNSIEEQLASEEAEIGRRRERWQAIRPLALPIVQLIWSFDGRVDVDSDLNLHVSGDTHRLAAIVRALRTRGFKSQSDAPEKGKSSWYARFRHEDCSTDIWLAFSSTVCRRVKVGTKLEEVDVYDTVCDELVLPEQKSSDAAA